MRNTTQMSPSAQVPLVWAYLAVPVGGVLMALYAAWLLIFPKSAPVVEDDLESFLP
jgi:TRAP-type C4-dicarboxylate transport system permease small subunit